MFSNMMGHNGAISKITNLRRKVTINYLLTYGIGNNITFKKR